MSRFSAAELGLPGAVPCPFCEKLETELHSAFGSQLSVATYWCRRCATAFEWFKGQAPPGDASGADSVAVHARGRAGKSRGPEHAGNAKKVAEGR